MTPPRSFVTLSKFPPYRSGHAQQALWNNRALAAVTGAVQHQVTYCGDVTGGGDDAGAGVEVHHVRTGPGNDRVPDGHLLKAMSAELVRVVCERGVDVILTYYADPHAVAANRALSTLRYLGRRPLVVHSVEGSDVLNSMCEHTGGKEAATLVADCLQADVLCAVSRYIAERFLNVVERALGPVAADRTAERVHIRYPGLPPESFAGPDPTRISRFGAGLGLPEDGTVVSSIGRLAPEKGLDTVLDVAALAAVTRSDMHFVIAGAGSLPLHLNDRAHRLSNVRVLENPSPSELHLLRARSHVALLPTRAVPGFVETFCVSALEYAALGVPALATDIGGVSEATADSSLLMPADSRPQEWWHRLQVVLERSTFLSGICKAHAARFTSRTSALRILELAERAALPAPAEAFEGPSTAPTPAMSGRGADET